MKYEQLPSYTQCEEAKENGEASSLELFIQDNEPAGIEDEKLFRTGLLNLINEISKNAAFKAWHESRLSFSKEIGGDVSEEEFEEPICKNFEEFVDKHL